MVSSCSGFLANMYGFAHSLQPTLVVAAPGAISLSWLNLRESGNSQVRSGLVMQPDKAVRTAQQTAVLCTVSEKSMVYYAGPRT